MTGYKPSEIWASHHPGQAMWYGMGLTPERDIEIRAWMIKCGVCSESIMEELKHGARRRYVAVVRNAGALRCFAKPVGNVNKLRREVPPDDGGTAYIVAFGDGRTRPVARWNGVAWVLLKGKDNE